MTSDVCAPHNHEDRQPLTSLSVNILQNARDARATHINGIAKLSNKCLRGPWSTDAQKLESMFTTIDRINAIFSLAEDLRQYLLSVYSKSNCPQSSLQPAIDVFAFMGTESKVSGSIESPPHHCTIVQRTCFPHSIHVSSSFLQRGWHGILP